MFLIPAGVKRNGEVISLFVPSLHKPTLCASVELQMFPRRRRVKLGLPKDLHIM